MAGFDPNLGAVQGFWPCNGTPGSTVFPDPVGGHTSVRASAVVSASSKYGDGAAVFAPNVAGYLRSSVSSDFYVGTTAKDFTIEFWAKTSSVIDNLLMNLFINTTSPASVVHTLYINLTATGAVSLTARIAAGTSTYITSGTGLITANAWAHIAITREAGTWRLFINGTHIGSSTTVPGWTETSTHELAFGTGANMYVTPASTVTATLYVDDIRFTVGKARYGASGFNAPAEELPDAGCIALLNFNGSNGATTTTESAGFHPFTFTNGAQLATAQKKYGVSSLFLDGTNDYLTTPRDAGFNLVSGNFTIEAWLGIISDVSSGTFNIINNWDGTNGWELKIVNGRLVGKLAASTTVTLTGSTSLGFNATPTFRHVCFQRVGSTIALYLDGVQEASGTINGASTLGASTPTIIGANSAASAEFFPGYIDDLRVVKNYNMYPVGGFTAPTEQLTNDITIHGSGAL